MMQAKAQAPASRLALVLVPPSGPRPNALPLHNVRYRKILAPKRSKTFQSTFPPKRRDRRSRKTKLIKSHRKRTEEDAKPGLTGSPKAEVHKARRLDPKLVEPDGIEPTTSCLQSTRSPN